MSLILKLNTKYVPFLKCYIVHQERRKFKMLAYEIFVWRLLNQDGKSRPRKVFFIFEMWEKNMTA